MHVQSISNYMQQWVFNGKLMALPVLRLDPLWLIVQHLAGHLAVHLAVWHRHHLPIGDVSVPSIVRTIHLRHFFVAFHRPVEFIKTIVLHIVALVVPVVVLRFLRLGNWLRTIALVVFGFQERSDVHTTPWL